MTSMEQMELEGHREDIVADVKRLIEKYRAIFDWDVPEIDRYVADGLILGQVRMALHDVEQDLLGDAEGMPGVVGPVPAVETPPEPASKMPRSGAAMSRRPPRTGDSGDAMTEAYEFVLEKAHRSGAAVHDAVDAVRGDLAAWSRFGGDEIDKVEAYVTRDLLDAAEYLNRTGKNLAEWLGFDTALVKREFWEHFSAAADRTTTQLYQLKRQAEDAGLGCGELVGLGTLVCDECGEKLHFHQPGRIPPCPKCSGTRFHRQRR